MAQSRTIKTLTALVIAMTLGAFALILMETGPIIPSIPRLAATDGPSGEHALVTDTSVPIDRDRQDWRNIVIHTAAEGSAVASNCHFTVSGATATASQAWKRQAPARHVHSMVIGLDYNADSIGVCLSADYSQPGYPKEEFDKAARLVRHLQRAFEIDRSRVYFHSDLNDRAAEPTPIVKQAFEKALLRSAS